MEGMEIPVKIIKKDGEIDVVYGQFSINQNISVSIISYLEAEEILDLEDEMKSQKREFMTKVWIDVPTYINLTTALFELYGEELDKGLIVPDDDVILKFRNAEMSDEEFIDGLCAVFGVM